MHRIDGDNVAVALPVPQAVGATVGYFKAEDDPPWTQVTGDWLNAVQEELANAIELSGLTLSKEGHEQLYDAIKSCGGRTWWRCNVWLPDFAASTSMTTSAAGLVPYAITRNAMAATHASKKELGGDTRGLEVHAAQVRYQCTTGFDGTINAANMELWHREADGTETKIGTCAMDIDSAGAVISGTITLTSNPVLALGETLYALLDLDVGTSGSVGSVNVLGIDVQFQEGHDL